MQATQVPCGPFKDDVAPGSAPGTKFSPPMTRLVAAQVAGLVASAHSALAVFEVPESMTPTTTPCPKKPEFKSGSALVSSALYG